MGCTSDILCSSVDWRISNRTEICIHTNVPFKKPVINLYFAQEYIVLDQRTVYSCGKLNTNCNLFFLGKWEINMGSQRWYINFIYGFYPCLWYPQTSHKMQYGGRRTKYYPLSYTIYLEIGLSTSRCPRKHGGCDVTGVMGKAGVQRSCG